jgi:hypothetical protein
MKIARWMTVLFAAMLLLGAATAQTTTYDVAIAWTPSPTAACTTTVTKSCVVGYTVTDVTVTGSPVVLAGPSVLNASATSFTTPVLTYTAQITRLYTVAANYTDSTGAAKVTGNGSCGTSGTPAPCAVVIFYILPPSNLTVTPVQISKLVEASDPTGMM